MVCCWPQQLKAQHLSRHAIIRKSGLNERRDTLDRCVMLRTDSANMCQRHQLVSRTALKVILRPYAVFSALETGCGNTAFLVHKQCRQWSAGTPISYSGFNWPRVFTRENIWHAAGKAGLFLFTFYHVCFLWKCIITLISLNGHCFSKTLSLKVHRHKKPAESYNEEDRACQVHLHYWYK